MEQRKWRVAVIGSGSFANWQYFPYIVQTANAECVAACDIIPERARDAAQKYGIPRWFSSVEELLNWGEFDIAIDAASIPAHHGINMAVLRAGKHLISQKPAAPTVEQITQQMEAAKKAGVKFCCVPIHMMTPDMLMAKQMIADGAIGDVLSVKCVSAHGGPEYFQYRDSDPSWFYQPGAGALYDMGVHALHKVTGVMGPAKRVGCMAANALKARTVRSGALDGATIRTDQMPDTYYITLDFGGDRIGFVDTGFTQRATRCVPMEIYGDRGTISFEPHNGVWPNPKLYIDSPQLGVRGWMEPQTWVKNTRPPHFTQCCCLADIIRAIETDTDPVLSAEQARHVIEIMCAIPEAIRTGSLVSLKTVF